jgi:hypothetical protein
MCVLFRYLESFGEEAVELMLTYHGPLPACQNEEKHSDQKQRIRIVFSQQLQKKFEQLPTLIHWSKTIWRANDAWPEIRPHEKHVYPFREVDICGFKGVAIVNAYNGLACHLDIEILRREVPGGVLSEGGDVDNRLKPLLDALALPAKTNQVPGNMWGKGERLYCLLEDDALVSRLLIDIQRWDEDASDPSTADWVQLRVKARIFPFEIRAYHTGF